MYPSQFRVPPAQIPLCPEVFNRIGNQLVIATRVQEGGFRVALGNGCQAKRGERTLQYRISVGFANSMAQISAPLIGEHNHLLGLKNVWTRDPVRQDRVGEVIA